MCTCLSFISYLGHLLVLTPYLNRLASLGLFLEASIFESFIDYTSTCPCRGDLERDYSKLGLLWLKATKASLIILLETTLEENWASPPSYGGLLQEDQPSLPGHPLGSGYLELAFRFYWLGVLPFALLIFWEYFDDHTQCVNSFPFPFLVGSSSSGTRTSLLSLLAMANVCRVARRSTIGHISFRICGKGSVALIDEVWSSQLKTPPYLPRKIPRPSCISAKRGHPRRHNLGSPAPGRISFSC